MPLFDEHSIREILIPLLRDRESPLRLLTHASPSPTEPYVLQERWIDTFGNTYLVDDNRVIHNMDSPPRRHYPTWSYPHEEHAGILRLRMRAALIIDQLIPSFEHLKYLLHPFESNHKRQRYTFRWEKSGLYEFEATPTLSLTFATDGTLLSMTNSLTSSVIARPAEQPLNPFHKLSTTIKFIQEQTETCTSG